MYNGDRSRKETLVEYGFRLPSALDNRPLKFDEFESLINQAIFISATPGDWELDKVNYRVTEQIIRPTGLLDPEIEVRPTKGQIDDIIFEIGERIKKIRETREMTRAELGALVGLDQNRVQQYENGKRKPKIPLLKKFAAALGVETIALMDPTTESYVGAMHALFQMEEKLDMKIVKKDFI